MAQINPAERLSDDVGVLVSRLKQRAEYAIVLVDMPDLKRLVTSTPMRELPTVLDNPYAYVLGYLTVVDRPRHYASRSTRRVGSPDACGDTLEVTAAAARRGWGPLLHDVALGFAAELGRAGVVPDRSSNTEPEQAIWRHYWIRRPDVESEPVPTNCPRFSAPTLDRVYRAGPTFDVAALGRAKQLTAKKLRALAVSADLELGPLTHSIVRAGVGLFLDLFHAEVLGHPTGGRVANPRKRALLRI
jgi:hypothetical protein